MKYFSVTQVLSPFCDFSKIPPDVLEYAATRGTAVHRICLNVYAKGLPTVNIPDDCFGYFQSFKMWFDEYVTEVISIEKEYIDRRFGYVGHVDLVCILKDGRIVIIDLKTPAVESPTWKCQLAAYRAVVADDLFHNMDSSLEIPEKNGCLSLQLKPNGNAAKAIVYQYSDNDFAAFLSALNAYRYFN